MRAIETPDELIANARALLPMLRESAEEIDEARRLPPDIVAALKKAGCFRMSHPRAWGGCEADPLTQNRVIETLASASGSAGWCAMIGAANNYFAAYLDQDAARKMLPDVDMVVAAAFVPPARATVVPGGYRVSGRLPFASGITHSDWVTAGCVVIEGGDVRTDGAGLPLRRFAMAPIDEVEVLDTWRTGGLRGTGSNDFVFNDVFVPEDHTFSLDEPARRPGPLYSLNSLFLANHPAVPLGIARGAAEFTLDTLATKTGKFGAPPREQASIHYALGNAAVLVESSRAFVYSALGELWAALESGKGATVEQRVRLRLAITHAHDACARAVQQLYHIAGSVAVYTPNVLDRCLRDIHAADQHVIATVSVYEAAGRSMLTGKLPPLW